MGRLEADGACYSRVVTRLYRFHFWLRLRPWYRRVAPAFLSCALLLPVLGLLGFTQAGHQIDNFIERDPNWIEQLLERTKVPPRSEREPLYHLNDAIVGTYAGLLVLTMLARVIRDISGRRKRIRINDPGDHEVYAPRGFTVLEASRFAGVAHTSICGGRVRCSTCRIRVSEGLSKQPPPSSAEQRVLQRVGAAPNVRLACQASSRSFNHAAGPCQRARERRLCSAVVSRRARTDDRCFVCRSTHVY